MIPEQGFPDTLREKVRDKALLLGFDAVGFARADVELEGDGARYEAFLSAGYHGQMAYLAENRSVRSRVNDENVLEGAKSVICVAARYARPDDPEETPEGSIAGLIARYARGRDYHKGMRRRVQHLARYLRSLGEGVRARPIVDTAPVLEKAWAARAGLGFMGKNGLIIIPGQGSYALLGEVVTTLELAPSAPMAERCGSCTRCLDACPTGAFPQPFVLDARRCIAYLTIELRGAVEEPLRAGIGEHLFGCDVCQEVCPFNRTAPPSPAKTEAFAPHQRWRTMTIADVLSLTESEFSAVTEGTPLGRLTLADLKGNAAIVAGNQRDPSVLTLLAELARSHADPRVREHAAWAVASIEGRG